MSIDPGRVEDLISRVRTEVEQGLLPACQFAVGYDGAVVVSGAFGECTVETRFTIFSATKALIAATMWELIAEGLLDPADAVADHIPEFAENGKGAVTVEQVMTHTSGFPGAPLRPAKWADRATRLEAMSQWRLNWEPGTRFEYHPTSAHWVLAELIARADGGDHREAVRRRVLDPVGLTRLELGVDEDGMADVAPLSVCGEEPATEELRATFGVDRFDRGEVTPEALLMFNQPEVAEVGVPGAGAVSTASDVALLYQAFLHNRTATTAGPIFDPALLGEGTGTIRCTLPDPLLGTPANRSLGLIVAGDDGTAALRGMGHRVGPRAFGHNGAGGQIAWADPDSGLSFCYLTNGLDRHFLREARRTAGIASRAALLTRP